MSLKDKLNDMFFIYYTNYLQTISGYAGASNLVVRRFIKKSQAVILLPLFFSVWSRWNKQELF